MQCKRLNMYKIGHVLLYVCFHGWPYNKTKLVIVITRLRTEDAQNNDFNTTFSHVLHVSIPITQTYITSLHKNV